MIRIVVLDGYAENPGDLSWDAFRALGELEVHDRTPPEMTAERIGDAQAVIINKAPITQETLEACPSLRYVGVLATGYNVVDVAACARRGVMVTNVPSYGTAAVAQFTIALLLELCSRVGDYADAVRAGRWAASPDWTFHAHPLVELDGKTIGIVGYGRIGRTVAAAAAALGMRVLAYGPRLGPDDDLGAAMRADLDTLFSSSDVVSLHCPLTGATKGMIDARRIRTMKRGALIVNTARGGLIAERDLRDALDSGHIGGAALDVVSEEPIRADNPLVGAPNLILTPHIAWAPLETRRRLMELAAGNLAAFLAGTPRNVVTA